mmetsp:Transcript_16809/g.39056  ORF Transcript_16809/g.39056 Transcript_16809/m.39056 type:complete len:215 (+) Transcript_16809:588-1232(+)
METRRSSSPRWSWRSARCRFRTSTTADMRATSVLWTISTPWPRRPQRDLASRVRPRRDTLSTSGSPCSLSTKASMALVTCRPQGRTTWTRSSVLSSSRAGSSTSGLRRASTRLSPRLGLNSLSGWGSILLPWMAARQKGTMSAASSVSGMNSSPTYRHTRPSTEIASSLPRRACQTSWRTGSVASANCTIRSERRASLNTVSRSSRRSGLTSIP